MGPRLLLPWAPRPLGRLAAALVLAITGCDGTGEAPVAAGLSVAEVLSGEPGAADGYALAAEPRTFTFPGDHGPHPAFRTEWWYFTGNLETPDGRRVGYQLTFFRNALAPPRALDGDRDSPEERPSDWATRQAWLAHFALTDGSEGTFHADQRLVRGGPIGLAGARLDGGGLAVHVADWSARPAAEGDDHPSADAPLAPLRLTAGQPEAAIDLELTPVRGPVLHGERGLSHKGGGPGNASYYYSFTRLRTEGTVRLGDRTIPVSGLSWMDREWSTSALAEDQVGWDWFALQLDDGRDLMLYLLRVEPQGDGEGAESDGESGTTVDPASSGTLVHPDGGSRHLERDDFSVDVLDRWRSPTSGALYPAAWRVRVPSAELDLEVRPVIPNQELDVGFRYWEGAVDVAGTRVGQPVRGRGYVELTGYADSALAPR